MKIFVPIERLKFEGKSVILTDEDAKKLDLEKPLSGLRDPARGGYWLYQDEAPPAAPPPIEEDLRGPVLWEEDTLGDFLWLLAELPKLIHQGWKKILYYLYNL